MQYFLNLNIDPLTGYPVIGVNSQAFATADPIFIDTSGWLTVVTTSSKVLGFSKDNRTMSSTNQTVAAVKPLYTPWLGVVVVITADQAVTQTDLAQYADIGTNTSGAMILNFVAGATGQFHCLGFDPNADGSTTLAVVEVAEPQQMGFAQT